jgi:surfactin synthase thioesterase subunit
VQQTPLICLPFAGAGASFFRDWGEHATVLDIAPVQLPGREKRFTEPPYTDATQAADGLLDDVLELISASNGNGNEQRPRPVALFGHSLGAVLAYELTRRLVLADGITVTRLVVSGCPGPANQRSGHATGLADDQFLQRVREFAGYDHPAFADAEMRELLLPTLRADVQMHESYAPADDTTISVPITAVVGAEDPLVSTADAAEWGKATSLDFRLVEVPGNHMYLAGPPEPLVRLLEDEICDQEGTRCG